MNPSASLKSRLSKLENKNHAQNQHWHDLSHLTGYELDRLKELGHLGLDDTDEGQKRKKEFIFLINKCPIVSGTRPPPARPPFPRPLVSYWRQVLSQDYPNHSRQFVRYPLSFAAKDCILELSEAYGWDSQTGSYAKMEPLDHWHPDDRDALITALYN